MFDDLSGRLLAHADADASRIALEFPAADPGGRKVQLTYGELAVRSRAMAGALAGRLKPGDRALLLLPAIPEFAVSFLGCLAAGVIAVPVPLPVDDASRRRVLEVARDCSASLIVSVSVIRAAAAAENSELCQFYSWLLVDGLEGAGAPPGARVNPPADPGDVAFLQYTSGSTRSPRGVMVSHGALLSNEAAISESFGVRSDSVIVSWLPLHHDMGLIGGLLQPLYAGARGVILDPLSFVRRPASWLEAISREGADISGGPNFAYELCIRKVSAEEKSALDLSSWRVAFNGAAQVFPRTMRSFSDAFREAGFRHRAHVPCYGLAEATLLVTSASRREAGGTRLFSTTSLESGQAMEAAPGDGPARELVCYPLPSHAVVRVVDPATGQPADEGCMGEIVVAGDSNGSGYWGDPVASAATFAQAVAGEGTRRFMRTGDLGFVYLGGLFIEGRSKDLIVHRGRNLHPEDLEADIGSCDPDVRPGCTAVFGTDYQGDEAVIVCQEVRASAAPDRGAEIVARIRAAAAGVHGVSPRTVVLLPPGTITKTSSGKVRRHDVKRRFLARELPVRYESTVGGEARQASLTDRIAAAGRDVPGAGFPDRLEIFTGALCDHLQDVLGLPARPRGDETLIALGADSLAAVQVQHDIEEACGVWLPPSAALRAASITELAQAALRPGAAVRPADVGAGEAVGEPGRYELNAGQRAVWFLQRAFPDAWDYNITRAFRLTGDVDTGRLSSALAAVVLRHPSLRLVVLSTDGEPRGVVQPEPGIRLDVIDARSWAEEEEADKYRAFATTPFELERGPLMRARLLRRARDWLLLLSVHHIVCDVSSLAIVVSEVSQEYTARPGPGGPDDAGRSGDRISPAQLERARLAERGEELAAYWKRQLAGELPILALPRIGRVQGGRSVSAAFEADAELTAGLMRYATGSGLTVHNVLLAAYQVMLHRLTGQADLVVGVPAWGRDRRLASHVGYLVNVLPVRSSFTENSGFTAFAARTQARVVDGLDHQGLPLSVMTRQLNPDRYSAAASIFQAMFAFYTTALPGGESVAAAVMGDPDAVVPMGRAALHGYPVPDYTTQAHVCLNAALRRGRLGFELQYDPRVVSPEQSQRLQASFLTLLSSIIDDPQAAVRDLALLDAHEVAALMAAGTGPRIPRPVDYLSSFEQMAQVSPDAPAVDDGVTRLTYAELDERANHVAARLRDRGVGVDARVVVSAGRSARYLVTLLGIHKADGCYVPIRPDEAPRRAAAMIAAVAPVAAIADEAGLPLLAGAVSAAGGTGEPGVLDMADLTAGRSPSRPGRAGPGQGASYIIHTSGSTGRPKPAITTNDGLTNHLWQMAEHLGLGPEDCVGQTAPVSFDISVWQFLVALIVGARIRIVPEPASLSPAGLLEATLDGGVTLLELVPSVIVALLDAGLADAESALRVMITTGETLTEEVPLRWRREMPAVPMYNVYGPCECADDVSMGLCASGPEAPVSIAIGRPLANSSMFVLDDSMNPVPAGVTGTLCIGGIGVGRGYHGEPRRTAAVFTPDPWSDQPGARLYHTGDLGRVTASGDVEFLGRADTQIKIRGVRIEAGEVEAALRECPGVTEAAVKVHRGPAGASLAGFVAGPAGLGPGQAALLDPGEEGRLRAALSERLPRQMIPTILVRVDRLPRSGNGKVDYAALRYVPPEVAQEPAAEQAHDPFAAAVQSIWATVLSREAVAWNDSFFELGGHSLVALAMIDRVKQALGVDLGVDEVFAHPRLGEFVAAVRRADFAPPAEVWRPAAPADPSAPVPASAAQQRFWFLHELDPERPTYNMPGVLQMHGLLDEDALETALREVLGRHRVLLARFSDEDGVLTWTPAGAEDFDLARLDLRGPVAEFGDEVFDRLVADEARKPMDLRQEIPFRALLTRVGPKDWNLFVTIDHIACDGWSLLVFLSDLAEGYNRRTAERPLPPGTTEYGFADYCRYEQTRRGRLGQAEAAAMWRDSVRGHVSVSPLPRRAGPADGPQAGRITRWFAEDMAAAISELAGRSGVTPYMVFATALSALTHSGRPDRETIMLGTLIAQRDRPEWQRVVGPLLNVSVLAVSLAPGDTAAEALLSVRDGAVRAYRWGHLPFQELLPLLNAPQRGEGSPFDVMLIMQPTADGNAEFDGLTTCLRDIDTGAAPYPLTVDVEPRGDAYCVSYWYATDCYDPVDMHILADRFDALIRAIVHDPERPLADILELAPTIREGR